MSSFPVTALRPSRVPSERRNPRHLHRETVARLASVTAPPALSVYDPANEIGGLVLEHVDYLRRLVDIFCPIFERVADDAADYGGARAESFEIVRAAIEDFVAPLSDAAERLIDND